MTTLHSIVNKSANFVSYISNNIHTAEDIEHDEVLKSAYQMYRLNPQSIFLTCPVSHKEFFYLSENCSLLFGYDSLYMSRVLRSPGSYLSQIHHADAEDLHDCFSFLQRFFNMEIAGSPQDYRCFLYYRFRHANGSYIYLQDQKATFAAADKTICYCLMREMDAGAPFQGVKMEIYREHPHYEKILTYKPSEANNKLSLRENELVNLMRQGLTTKEIAGHLDLSSNTVRNIKSRMFSKFKVNNSIELLNVTG